MNTQIGNNATDWRLCHFRFSINAPLLSERIPESFTAYFLTMDRKAFKLLPHANKVWGKVIFSELSVILYTGGGGSA